MCSTIRLSDIKASENVVQSKRHPLIKPKACLAIVVELQYAQQHSAKSLFFFVQTIISNLIVNIFKTLSLPNRKSQVADILKKCSLPTTCHMLLVICHMSHVLFQVSCIPYKTFFWLLQSGEAIWWGVCYQQGPTLSGLQPRCSRGCSTNTFVTH